MGAVLVLVGVLAAVAVLGVVLWGMTVVARGQEQAEDDVARHRLEGWGRDRGLEPQPSDDPEEAGRVAGEHRGHQIAVALDRPQADDGRPEVRRTVCTVRTGVDLPDLVATRRRRWVDRSATELDEVLRTRGDRTVGALLGFETPAADALFDLMHALPPPPWRALWTTGDQVHVALDGYAGPRLLDHLVAVAVEVAEGLADAADQADEADKADDATADDANTADPTDTTGAT
ncbi:MAG TPA: hypothetical protein VIL36_17320 [Acidimicrobiales bacterium]